ncbi:MAG: lytic transglycosylase domain-containing protein [Ruminococcaceae bacterium]|nr:lytic transglycosylase domain-containing protein [Oscillospiraceae bacterium]
MNTPKRRGPSHSVMVFIILLIAVGVGFLFDFLWTQAEYLVYPKKYSEYVEVYAEKYHVPENAVYAVIKTESDFDSGAVSPKGAVGLMQLMPDTFRWLGHDILGENLADGMMYDPETNIRYGCCLLSRLYDRYGSWDIAFAAYNAGSSRVDGWLDGEGKLSEIPIEETRAYVKKATDALEKYNKLYGVESVIITTAEAIQD